MLQEWKRSFVAWGCLVLFCVLTAVSAWAQAEKIASPAETLAEKAELQTTEFKEFLADLSKTLQSPPINSKKLKDMRGSLEQSRVSAVLTSQALGDALKDVQSQIDKFTPLDPQIAAQSKAGEAAKEVRPLPKDDPLSKEKKRLEDLLARLQKAKAGLDVVTGEAEQLVFQIATLQKDAFVKRIFESSPSILNPLLWTQVVSEALDAIKKSSAPIQSFVQNPPYSPLVLAAFFCVGLLVFAGLFMLWMRLLRAPGIESGTTFDPYQKLFFSVRTLVLTVLFFAGGFLVLHLVLLAFDVTSIRALRLVFAIFEGLVTFLFVRAFARAVFRPRNEYARLIPLSTPQASRMAFLVTLAGFATGIENFFSELGALLYFPVILNVGWSAAGTVIALLCLAWALLILRSFLEEQRRDASSDLSSAWQYLMVVGWGMVLASTMSVLLGYIALGEFLVTQLLQTPIIVSSLYMLYCVADHLVGHTLQETHRVGAFLKGEFKLSSRALKRLSVILSTLVDLSVLLVGIPVLLAHWSLTWIDYSSWFRAFLTGFQVGSLTISPGHFFLGIGVFFGGLALAKLFSFWLDRRILSQVEIDGGVRHSLDVTTHYALLLGVGIFALSSMGFDLSNLALVAGALGVGIGFGLQSIVNNFVSGLILLVERPIRVGDWIIVPEGEGIVKKINVRSTTIETFDRASVIMPNSNLITNPLTNKTLRGQLGRTTVVVEVKRGACPEEIKSLLLEIAMDHSRVLSFPEPFVLFSSLTRWVYQFTLYAYVDDVGVAFLVASDLRFEIQKRFSQKKIAFNKPFEQTPVKKSYFARHHTAVSPRPPRFLALKTVPQGEGFPPSTQPKDEDL